MSDANAADGPSPEPVPSGIDGLDVILRGGFLKGGIYIVQGEPGAGKTILGNQLCYAHAAAGGKALYVTLLAENHARMMMHMRAFSFFDPAALPASLYYISAFATLEESGLQGLVELLRREVVAQGTTMMVLDGFVAAEEMAGSDTALKKFVHQLQTAAILADCTMFLLTSVRDQFVSAEHTMVDGIVELSDQRQGGWRTERRLEVRKFRGAGQMRGRHAYRIAENGIEVFPRIEGLSRPAGGAAPLRAPARVSTGVAPLDDLLGGGLPAGSTTLVAGPPGIGKSTLGLHLISGSSGDEPGLLLGFDEEPARLLAKADALGLGLRALVTSGAVEILWQPATEGVLDELGQRLLENVRRRRARRVVIDSLAGLEQATGEPGRMRSFGAALAHQLRGEGATTLYTAERESLAAETIIVMRYVDWRAERRRLISVLKVRDAGFDAAVREFTITSEGLVVDETSQRARALLADAAGYGGDAPPPAESR